MLVFDTNIVPASFWDAIFQWKQFMKTVGWKVPMSGTGTGGTTQSSDLITAAGSGNNPGAGFLAQADAWFVITDPGGARSFCIWSQGNGRDDFWRVKYSAKAGFTGGSAGQPPTATDEQLLIGSGLPDPSGGGNWGSWFPFNASGTRRMQMFADNAAPYGFFVVWYASGGAVPDACFIMDPVLSAAAGDADPVVVHCGGNDSGCLKFGGSMLDTISGPTGPTAKPGLMGPAAWYLYGQTGQSWARVRLGSDPLWPNKAGSNSHTNKDDLLPAVWARDPSSAGGGPSGYKGISTLLLLNSVSRANGDAVSVSAAGARDFATFGHITAPWNGGDLLA
jgi:hypothetical protein